MRITGDPREIILFLILVVIGYYLTGQNANMSGVILLAVSSFLLGRTTNERV